MSVIFWDFDGTLVHSNSLWSNSVYTALLDFLPDTDVKFTDIRKCMAKGFTWHTPDNDYSSLTYDKWWEFMTDKIYNDYISLGVNADISDLASSRVRSIIKRKENYIIYYDAVETLKLSLNKGNTNVILSNNYPDLDEVLDELNLTQFFDRIIVSACVGYDKPRKEVFDIAKSYYPDNDYIMIGDSVNADIIGGKNAGMTTILVHKGFSSQADYCFDNLGDIKF